MNGERGRERGIQIDRVETSKHRERFREVN